MPSLLESPEMTSETPIVVYHVAAMGNWQEVVREQFALLRESGLAAGVRPGA